MSAVFKRVGLSREDILAAIRKFERLYPRPNDYDKWLDKATYKWAIQHSGKLYPTKWIISEATGLALDQVKTAERRNAVLAQLGFQVIRKPSDT